MCLRVGFDTEKRLLGRGWIWRNIQATGASLNGQRALNGGQTILAA